MTAIAAVILDERIVLTADGVSYAPDGKVVNIASKLFALPHLECVFANAGLGGVGAMLLLLISVNNPPIVDFDGLLHALPELFREAYEFVSQAFDMQERSTILIAGWSKSKGAFQAFKIHSAPKEIIGAEGKQTTTSDYVVTQVSDLWLLHMPSAADIARFGLNGEHSGVELAVRAVCAARPGSDPTVPFGVGAFVQVMTLDRTGIRTWIAHRWPDRIGVPVDATLGEPMPPMPVAEP